MDLLNSLKPKQFANQFLAVPGAILIDVRTEDEFNSGHIAGAININFEDDSFKGKVSPLNKSKPYFICCRAGNRSIKFCEYLLGQGFKDVYNLEAGIFSWVNYGYPISKQTAFSKSLERN